MRRNLPRCSFVEIALDARHRMTTTVAPPTIILRKIGWGWREWGGGRDGGGENKKVVILDIFQSQGPQNNEETEMEVTFLNKVSFFVQK